MRFIKIMTSQGIPLYACYLPHANSVTITVMVKAGTCDEIWPNKAGLAHAMEHMVFRGTEDFADNQKISAHIENTGGWLNAYTSKNYTYFQNQLPCVHIEKGIYSLSQLIRKPLLRPKDIKTEMRAIIQEIKQRNDDPSETLFDEFVNESFKGHPLGRDVLGTEKSVLSFKTDDFKNWQNKYYRPENFVFFVVGNFKLSETKKLFEKYFPENAANISGVKNNVSIVPTKKFRQIFRNTEQSHLVVGTIVPKADNPDTMPLLVFQQMISGGMSSPLFQEVRGKKGLAYDVAACHWLYTQLSLFFVYVGTDPKKTREAIKISLQIIKKSKNSKKLMEIAKEAMIGELNLAMDNPEKILVAAIEEFNLFNKVYSLKERVERIKAVTIGQISNAVEKYLLDENRHVTLILGPKTK